ncbi:PREDICTED: furin-like protease kpc-1 [Branchiostoma belcheri]|uniref:Furin-like protease kpc-1 n=1 Tax=Branchiostoma belcheri TaxID=7741 RepID=A0A6P5ABX8_BRABE|nr:PREDICTED: furin-like protease kpc-1 [Branchiostoma belcheri]
MIRVYLAVLVLAIFGERTVSASGEDSVDIWAIELSGGVLHAKRFAYSNGFTFLKRIINDIYLFKVGHNLKRTSQVRLELLQNSQVTWFGRQVPRKRYLRSLLLFDDPEWDKQSYLYTGKVNMNVLPAWNTACAGEGVTVGVVDDGVIVSHPDLQSRVDISLSYDFLRDRQDPTPPQQSHEHGTQCAGVIAAAANNSFCGVGVAYRAQIAGLRLLSGGVSDILDADEAAALTHKSQEIAIYSNSWGPSDYQFVLDGPEPLLQRALRNGVHTGRGGKGSIYIFSGGNGGAFGDSCAYDGYINSIYTIGINSVWPAGESAVYNEPCTAIMAAAYGNDFTDTSSSFVVPSQATGCKTDFSGTSPTAALAAGAMALVLEANPSLTWRDVQHLITRTTRTEGLCGDEWTTNKAGFKVNNLCGFGLMDVGAMVDQARLWPNVPDQVICQDLMSTVIKTIPGGGTLESTVDVNPRICAPDQVHYLEHVLVHVTLTFPHRGYLVIELTSPSGTTSTVAPGRVQDAEPDLDWTFLTLHHWGENPLGVWTLRVNNTHPDTAMTGSLSSWSLVLHGTASEPLNNDTTPASDLVRPTSPNCVTVSDDSDYSATKGINNDLVIALSVSGSVILLVCIAIAVYLQTKKRLSGNFIGPDARNAEVKDENPYTTGSPL